MGRFWGNGLRKRLAIVGLFAAWWLALGSEPAKAQTGPCTVNPDGSLACSFPAFGVFESCTASGFCTITCPNGGRVAAQFAGQTADQILASIIPQIAPGAPGNACLGKTTPLQNAAQAARQSSQVSMIAVQSQLTSIR